MLTLYLRSKKSPNVSTMASICKFSSELLPESFTSFAIYLAIDILWKYLTPSTSRTGTWPKGVSENYKLTLQSILNSFRSFYFYSTQVDWHTTRIIIIKDCYVSKLFSNSQITCVEWTNPPVFLNHFSKSCKKMSRLNPVSNLGISLSLARNSWMYWLKGKRFQYSGSL